MPRSFHRMLVIAAAAVIEFETSGSANLSIQTWRFGSGVNAAGAVVAAGGFDPCATLFSDWGATAGFVAANDDGVCPPGTASPSCADAPASTD